MRNWGLLIAVIGSIITGYSIDTDITSRLIGTLGIVLIYIGGKLYNGQN